MKRRRKEEGRREILLEPGKRIEGSKGDERKKGRKGKRRERRKDRSGGWRWLSHRWRPPPRVVYRPSLVKCRSAVIYLSRIDASPEVNGRVVTISRRTGQVRAVEDSANGGERGSTLISAPCEASTPRPNTMFPVPHPTDIPSHEPLNYFSIEGGRRNDRSRYRVPYSLDIFISDAASLYKRGKWFMGCSIRAWITVQPRW